MIAIEIALNDGDPLPASTTAGVVSNAKATYSDFLVEMRASNLVDPSIAMSERH
jgi:hypothetical protein